MQKRWRFYLPVLAFLVLGWAWALASPVGASADEDFHLPSIWCAWGDWEGCTEDLSTGSVTIPAPLGLAPCFIGDPNVQATCLLEQDQQETNTTTRVNPPTGTYPPLFHATMRAFAGQNVEKSVVVMRMFNVAIAAGIFLWALMLSPPVAARALALTWAAAIVPFGLFYIASVNPSSWAIIGGGTFWVFVYTLFSESNWRSKRAVVAALGALVTMSMAVLARADQGYLIGLSFVGVGIFTGFFFKERLKSLVLLTGLALVTVFVALRFSIGRYLQSFDFSLPFGNQITDQPNPLLKVLAEFPSFLGGMLGLQEPWAQRESDAGYGVEGWVTRAFVYGVGSADVMMPSLVGVLGIVIVSGTLFIALANSSRPKIIAVTLIFTGILLQVITMRSLTGWGSWETGSYVSFVYPRYLYPALLVFLGLSLVVKPISRPIFGQIQGLIVTGLLTLVATVALMATIGRYMHGQDHSWVQFELANGWWWGWGPDPVTVIILAAVAAIIYFGGMVSLSVRFPSPEINQDSEFNQGMLLSKT